MEKLTQAEREFAEQHHDMVPRYLERHRLKADEFYDIAAIGYLRAVHQYHANEKLRQKYQFSTIAYRCMYCDIGLYFRSLKTKMRDAPTISMDMPLYQDDAKMTWHERVAAADQSISDAAIDGIVEQDYLEQLTPMQQRIARLCLAGHQKKQIAEACGISLNTRYRNLDKMKVALCRTLSDRAA